MKQLRCLVTGATGFSGRALLSALTAAKHSVHAIRRPGSATVDVAGAVWWVYDGSARSLAPAFQAPPYDVVFHLAAISSYDCPPDLVADMVDANVTFGTQILGGMAASGSRRLVNAGTYWQHGKGEAPSPTCLYAALKQAFEAVIDHHVAAADLCAITLKLSDIYGPSDPRGKVFSAVAAAARTGTPLAMSPGEQVLRPLHVDDAASAFMAAGAILQDAQPGHARYFIAGEPVRLRQWVERFVALAGLTVGIDWGALPYRRNQIMMPFVGPSLPGWQPRWSLEQGLQQLVESHA